MSNLPSKPLGIIGRETEIALLEKAFNSPSPEFLAIYGRRRIGKTYLISNFFSRPSATFFQSIGIRNGKLSDQIKQFTQELSRTFYSNVELMPKTNWMDVFIQLQQAIETCKSEKIVLFLDELPWMATPKSSLLESLEFYWNRYGSKDPRVILIICGSSASWILENIINNREGLYNRVTQPIKLSPLTLRETQNYLNARGFNYPQKQIMEIYLALGGVPFYLNFLDPKFSVPQNLDSIFFRQTAPLLEEFNKLFASLFKNSKQHEQLIKLIGNHMYGLELKELNTHKTISAGGRLSQRLQELEDAGFIMKFTPYGFQNKGTFYRVVDPFSLFYLRFVQSFRSNLKKMDQGEGYWLLLTRSQHYKSWRGYAFEALCFQHLYPIRKALKIEADAGIYTWKYKSTRKEDSGSQVDLIFDRADDVIQLCEIKCTDKPYTITKTYRMNLKNKLETFKKQAELLSKNASHKIYFLSFISAAGLTDNVYSQELVNSAVSLGDLFKV